MATNIDLLSILPGIEPTANDILEAELLAYNILSAKFPNLDLREGTGLRDMVIRPNATLLAMITKALAFYFSQNSIAGVTDATTPAFVDKLMSNWFLDRKAGVKAIINARLFFAKSKAVTLAPDTYFSVDNTLKFLPLVGNTYSSNLLTLDVGTSLYYLDVDLIAESPGVAYNIGSGSLIYFSNFDPYFLHAEISYLSVSAGDPETNLQFVARAKDSISSRNLVNTPSISSKLRGTFSELTGVYTAGHGSIEMIRDQILVKTPNLVDPVWIHYGGCVDIYCRVPLEVKIVQLLTDATGKAVYEGNFYKAVRSGVTGGPAADDIAFGTVFTQVNPNTLNPLVTEINTSTALPYSSLYPTMHVTSAKHGLNVGEWIGLTLNNPAHGATTKYSLKVISVTSVDVVEVMVPTTWIGGALMNLTSMYTSYPTTVANIYMVDRRADVGFSPLQTTVFDFGNVYPNRTASFALYSFRGLGVVGGAGGIYNYLTDPTNHIVAGDYLPRGFNLTKLDVNIVGYSSLPNSVTATTVITKYLASLGAGQSFIMADLLSLLYAAGIVTIQTPIGITYEKFNRYGFNPNPGTIVDTHNPKDATNVFVLNSLTVATATI
jgi:hypothetical protein